MGARRLGGGGGGVGMTGSLGMAVEEEEEEEKDKSGYFIFFSRMPQISSSSPVSRTSSISLPALASLFSAVSVTYDQCGVRSVSVSPKLNEPLKQWPHVA